MEEKIRIPRKDKKQAKKNFLYFYIKNILYRSRAGQSYIHMFDYKLFLFYWSKLTIEEKISYIKNNPQIRVEPT